MLRGCNQSEFRVNEALIFRQIVQSVKHCHKIQVLTAMYSAWLRQKATHTSRVAIKGGTHSLVMKLWYISVRHVIYLKSPTAPIEDIEGDNHPYILGSRNDFVICPTNVAFFRVVREVRHNCRYPVINNFVRCWTSRKSQQLVSTSPWSRLSQEGRRIGIHCLSVICVPGQ